MTTIEAQGTRAKLKDEDYDRIAAIPEVNKAIKRYFDIQDEYATTVSALVRESSGRKMPRLQRINKQFRPQLDEQMENVLKLMDKYA